MPVDRHIAAAREWLNGNRQLDITDIVQRFASMEYVIADLAALLQATEDAERERCADFVASKLSGEIGTDMLLASIAAAIRKGTE